MKYIIKQIGISKIIFSFLIVQFALFMGAKDRIDWYFQNLSYLQGDTPTDISISAVQEIVNTFSGYDVFMNGIGMGNSGYYPILIFLSVGFLFSYKFSLELNNGSSINIITRIGYKKYYLNKMKITFASSFLFVFIILFSFLWICIIFFSPNHPIEGRSTALLNFTSMYYQHPFIYTFFQIINQSFFIAVFSLLSMCITLFTPIVIVAKVIPLTIYLFLTVTTQLLFNITSFSGFSLLFPDIIFTPFNVEGHTMLGFIGEKIISYVLFIFLTLFCQILMYRKYKINYLK